MNRDTLYAIFIEELVNVAPDLEAWHDQQG
jgi:hypothetical protein